MNPQAGKRIGLDKGPYKWVGHLRPQLFNNTASSGGINECKNWYLAKTARHSEVSAMAQGWHPGFASGKRSWASPHPQNAAYYTGNNSYFERLSLLKTGATRTESRGLEVAH